jgi:hypothetical protein
LDAPLVGAERERQDLDLAFVLSIRGLALDAVDVEKEISGCHGISP